MTAPPQQIPDVDAATTATTTGLAESKRPGLYQTQGGPTARGSRRCAHALELH